MVFALSLLAGVNTSRLLPSIVAVTPVVVVFALMSSTIVASVARSATSMAVPLIMSTPPSALPILSTDLLPVHPDGQRIGLIRRDVPGGEGWCVVGGAILRDEPAPDATGVSVLMAFTHLDILDQLVGIDAAALIASILVVEARHATVLHTFAGASSLAQQLASQGTALSPSDYPVK